VKLQVHVTQDAIQVAAEKFCLAVAVQLIHAAAAADQAFLTKLKIVWHKLVAVADAKQLHLSHAVV
jgi:hypothetical protein